MNLPRHTLSSGKRKLSWLEAGEGQPLVLIHAFPFNADMWSGQLDSPPPGWRLIAPDLRGFAPAEAVGGNAGGSRVTSIDDYAADIIDLLDALKIREAAIGGLSLGGYVAFALFRLARQYVRALVLADTRPTPDTDAGREGRRQLQKVADEAGAAGVARELLPKLLGDTTLRDRPDVVKRVRTMIESNTTESIKDALTALMTRPDSTPLLAHIHRPTLIIVGAKDGVTPVGDAEAMHLRIPGSVLSIIPDAGHLSNLEAPEEFNDALHPFLDTRV